MLSPDSLLKLVPSVLVAFIGWNLVRRFVFPSPLDRLPGPPPTSFIAGHLPQMFAPDGWGFHRSLVEKCEAPASTAQYATCEVGSLLLDLNDFRWKSG